jgi:hypothetical protein
MPRSVSVADRGVHPGGNLGEHVAESMNKTVLAQRFWVDLFDGPGKYRTGRRDFATHAPKFDSTTGDNRTDGTHASGYE